MIAGFLMEKPDSPEEFKRGKGVYTIGFASMEVLIDVFKAVLIERLIKRELLMIKNLMIISMIKMWRIRERAGELCKHFERELIRFRSERDLFSVWFVRLTRVM